VLVGGPSHLSRHLSSRLPSRPLVEGPRLIDLLHTVGCKGFLAIFSASVEELEELGEGAFHSGTFGLGVFLLAVNLGGNHLLDLVAPVFLVDSLRLIGFLLEPLTEDVC
jgi:hypothetical protein